MLGSNRVLCPANLSLAPFLVRGLGGFMLLLVSAGQVYASLYTLYKGLLLQERDADVAYSGSKGPARLSFPV